MTQMKVSDYLAEFLRVQGTRYVFELAGGMITHILDSIYRLGNTNIITVHHEQAAAFAVDAYGRITGRPGIAFATSGPGATNLLTGIGSCYFDSSPALFITGQVNTHELKGDRGVRQLGFQETDIVSMAKPITKKSYQVDKKENFAKILNEAYLLSMSGRPGPVLLDIPMNIQSSIIDVEPISYLIRSPSVTADIPIDHVNLLYNAIKTSKKPLILVGQGVLCAGARSEFIHFIDKVKIPVVTSLLGIDAIQFHHDLHVGLIGSYGNRWANLAIGQADLLIVIGSRLDIRQTGAHIDGFRSNKTIIHIDCDESEINNRIKNCIAIKQDIKLFLSETISQFASRDFSYHHEWQKEIKQLKQQWPDHLELKDFSGINPNIFMHQLSTVANEAAAFLVDVGNHQMWAAQSLEINSEQRFITSGGMGAMGFALPAAVGSALATDKKKPVVMIAGDGGFQLNIQELQTIVRNNLPIKLVILNNQCLGMIRQFQDSYFEQRYQSTYWGYSAPDFASIANAYHIPGRSISTPDETQAALQWLFEEPKAPALLQVMINPKMNAYPKIAFGKPITEMEPFAKPTEMEGT